MHKWFEGDCEGVRRQETAAVSPINSPQQWPTIEVEGFVLINARAAGASLGPLRTMAYLIDYRPARWPISSMTAPNDGLSDRRPLRTMAYVIDDRPERWPI